MRTSNKAPRAVKIVVTNEADLPENRQFTVKGTVLQDAVQVFQHGYSQICVTVKLASGKLYNIPMQGFDRNKEAYYARRLASCLGGDEVTLTLEYPEGANEWPTFVDFENHRMSDWASPDDLIPADGNQS